MFEAKGTKHRRNQRGQIKDGLAKKRALGRSKKGRYDIALIISTHIGSAGERPRILVADPEFPDYGDAFGSIADVVYRYRHYARAAQFAGFTGLATTLYSLSKELSAGTPLLPETQRSMLPSIGRASRIGEVSRREVAHHEITINGEEYVGQFLDTTDLPREYRAWLNERRTRRPRFQVFQGIRRSKLATLFDGRLGEVDNLPSEAEPSESSQGGAFSIFPDGTVFGLV
jgi:hypothetical protein